MSPAGHSRPRRAIDQAVAYWRTLAPMKGRAFDKEIDIDCDRIAPQVTWGTTPQDVAASTSGCPIPPLPAMPSGRAISRGRSPIST